MIPGKMNPFEAKLMLAVAWRLAISRGRWDLYFRALAASPPL